MYGKSFESMFEGSMVGAGVNVFAVWGYIITKAKRGFIEINPKLLAFTLGGTEDEITDALEFLQRPDPNSRSKLEEGRRLVKDGQFQYRIVNWAHYDEIKNEIERRDYNRIRQQQFRDRKQEIEPPVKAPKSKMPAVECVEIFAHLNQLTGSKFRPEGSALGMLEARLAQPDVVPAEVLKMISRQGKRWLSDPKMMDYLRPSTLFNATKFNEYYAARDQPIPNVQSGKPNPRNFGIATAGPSYGEAAKTKLERQRMVSEMAEAGDQGSAGTGAA